jgi:Uma2 family endonuclease
VTTHELLDRTAKYRLRVEDYLLLDQSGAFDGFAKTELIEGEIIVLSPQHRPHWYAKNELGYRLRRAVEELALPLYVGIEGSVLLSAHDLPEPDIVITDDPVGSGSIPVASVRLLVEVADSSSRIDLGRKPTVYAAAGIPEYWVADVNARAIHQMWQPQEGSYTQLRVVPFDEPMLAATIEGLTVDTVGF